MTAKKILIADDDLQFRLLMEAIIAKIFTDENVSVVHAQDGREAISLFDSSFEEQEPVDIVITDYVMPEVMGSEVIDHIIDTNPVPIVVVSAFPEAKRHDFIQQGAIYFLSKPFDVAAAEKALNAALALKVNPEDIEKAKDAIDRLKNLDI